MSQTQAKQAQRSSARPPRLRSACNQCNAAKLRCSGERDGCIRCQTLQTECIYTESRVGKVQGSRKRKKPHEQSLETSAPSATTSIEQTSVTSTDVQSWTEPWTSETTWTDEMVNLDENLNFGDVFEETSVASPENILLRSDYTQFTTQGTEHAHSSSLTFDVPQDLASFAPDHRTNYVCQHDNQEHVSIQPQTSLPTDARRPLLTPSSQADSACSGSASMRLISMQETPQDFSKLDSRCILACTHIVVTLENYLLSELRAFDLILATVNKAVDDLKRLIELQQQSRCDKCIHLFTIVMHQVIALLEAGLSSVTDREPDVIDEILSGTQPRLGPSVYFGAFLPTSEDQRSLRSRIITREYRHVSETLSSIMTLARSGSRGLFSGATDSPLTCLADIERRLKELAAKEGDRDI